jgi:hypothetical protein
MNCDCGNEGCIKNQLATLKAELNQAVYLSDKRAQERDKAEAEA